MTRHDELHSLAEGYALASLYPEQTRAFQEHLVDCDMCARRVAETRAVADLLPLAVDEQAPPPELRARVLSAVRQSSTAMPGRAARPGRLAALRSMFMRPAAGFAVLAIAVAVLAAWNLQLRADQDESRARLARTYEAISIMGQADQWWSVEAAEAAPEASGTLAYAAHRTAACLTVWGLPAEDGRAYHVWSVRDDVHIPAGTMWGIGAGKWIIMGGDIEETDAVVITLEEAANPPVPQGPIVARVNLASP